MEGKMYNKEFLEDLIENGYENDYLDCMIKERILTHDI